MDVMSIQPYRTSLLQILIAGSPAIPEHVRTETLRHLLSGFLRYKPLMAVLLTLNSTMVCGLLWYSAPRWMLFVWWAPVALISAMILLSGLKAKAFDPQRVPSGRFLKRAEISAFAIAVWWTSICLVPIERNEIIQMALLGLSVGTCAAVVSFTAPMVGVASRYILGAAPVIALSTLFYSTPLVTVTVVFGFALSLALMITAVSHYESAMDLILSRYESETAHKHLIAALESKDQAFAIYDKTGRLIIANDYHRRLFSNFALTDFEPVRREVKYREHGWFIQQVDVTGDGELVVTHVNIEHMKEKEKSLMDAQQDAERASKAKSNFMSRVSYEIRSPVKYMLTFASAMNSGSMIDYSETEFRANSDKIEKVGRDLLDLLADLEQYTKVEDENVLARMTTLDINQVLDVKALTANSKDAASRLTIKIARDVGSIIVDDEAFVMVVRKLTKRAMLVSPGPVLIVSQLDSKGRPVIAIVDRGRPTSFEDELELFDPEESDAASGSTDFLSKGLDLALCKKLVIAMGGEFRVSPAANIGTCISIILPADKHIPSSKQVAPKSIPEKAGRDTTGIA
jgi:signal transduction histidine kinase